jgi:hypothetical protein
VGIISVKQRNKFTYIDNAYRKDDMSRNLKRFSRCNLSGLCPTTKDSSPHFFESFNEANFAVMFEFDQTIIAVKSQPFSIKYIDNGRTKNYTPDFSIVDCNKTIKIIEVKAFETIDEKVERKHRCIEKAFNQCGFSFHVMTEKHLPSRLALSNMMMIKRNAIALGHVDQDALNYFLDMLSEPISLSEAVNICKCLGIDPNIISYCIFRDYVNIGVSSGIGGETIISSNIYGGAL